VERQEWCAFESGTQLQGVCVFCVSLCVCVLCDNSRTRSDLAKVTVYSSSFFLNSPPLLALLSLSMFLGCRGKFKGIDVSMWETYHKNGHNNSSVSHTRKLLDVTNTSGSVDADGSFGEELGSATDDEIITVRVPPSALPPQHRIFNRFMAGVSASCPPPEEP
jgi:hypothetical protein